MGSKFSLHIWKFWEVKYLNFLRASLACCGKNVENAHAKKFCGTIPFAAENHFQKGQIKKMKKPPSCTLIFIKKANNKSWTTEFLRLCVTCQRKHQHSLASWRFIFSDKIFSARIKRIGCNSSMWKHRSAIFDFFCIFCSYPLYADAYSCCLKHLLFKASLLKQHMHRWSYVKRGSDDTISEVSTLSHLALLT